MKVGSQSFFPQFMFCWYEGRLPNPFQKLNEEEFSFEVHFLVAENLFDKISVLVNP